MGLFLQVVFLLLFYLIVLIKSYIYYVKKKVNGYPNLTLLVKKQQSILARVLWL
ncbi:hypothetical protein FEP45_06059 [Burkholderia multivorans]|nr:hypothetical protein [Burkholderia multivorans]